MFERAWDHAVELVQPLRVLIDETLIEGHPEALRDEAPALEDLVAMLGKVEAFARDELPAIRRSAERLIAEIRKLS
jgi:hypothetical protein